MSFKDCYGNVDDSAFVETGTWQMPLWHSWRQAEVFGRNVNVHSSPRMATSALTFLGVANDHVEYRFA